MQKHKPLDDSSLDMIELLKQTILLPAVRKAILIALTVPPPSTVERSFSTLCDVRNWLRSTMNDTRLSGLCMLSVHRDKVNNQKTKIVKKSLENLKKTPADPGPVAGVVTCFIE